MIRRTIGRAALAVYYWAVARGDDDETLVRTLGFVRAWAIRRGVNFDLAADAARHEPIVDLVSARRQEGTPS